MDPFIEVVFPDQQQDVLTDRYIMPLFFLVGSVDDNYLSKLVNQDIYQLVSSRSVDNIPNETPFGVYASRSSLSNSSYARVFSLEAFLNNTWPILVDIDEDGSDKYNKSMRQPTHVEMVWIIRAFRRMEEAYPGLGYGDTTELIRTRLMEGIYKHKISKNMIPETLNVNTLSELYINLSDEQRDYPLVIIIDDLPIQLDKTLGKTLAEITVTNCTQAKLDAIDTSLKLLSMN